MKVKRKGVTWWRAIWPSALGSFVLVGEGYHWAVQPGTFDRTTGLLVLAGSFLACFAYAAYLIRLIWGPARVVLVPPPPLSADAVEALKRQNRVWKAVSFVGILGVGGTLIIGALPMALNTSWHLSVWEARAAILASVIFFAVRLWGAAGLQRVQRIRKEGFPLRNGEHVDGSTPPTSSAGTRAPGSE